MTTNFLHVGFQKTGTTSIQYWLRAHEELLSRYGLRFPRAWLHLNTHVELSLTLTRQDRLTQGRLRGDEWRDLSWRRDVLLQIIDDFERHRDVSNILSNEDLSLLRYDDEVEDLYRVVGDCVVIIYLRNRSDFLASLAAHYCKPTMAGLSLDPDAFNYVRPDSWLVHYEKRVALWKRHFSRVRVFDYDSVIARDKGSVIPSFLLLLGLPVVDAYDYRMQKRADPVPRLPGNRAYGLPFGADLPQDADT